MTSEDNDFQEVLFFPRQGFFFHFPKQLFLGLVGERSPPGLVKNCLWRVRKQCTKVRECKNSGTQRPAGEGSQRGGFLRFIFPSACSGPREGIQALEEAADSCASLKSTDICCSDGVWGLKFRECQLCSHCFPHTALSQTSSPPFFRKGDRGSQWMKHQPQSTQLSGQSWDLTSGPPESEHWPSAASADLVLCS